MGSGTVVDGTLAQGSAQQASIWHLRESLAEALSKEGMVYKYDVSLPLDHFYELVGEGVCLVAARWSCARRLKRTHPPCCYPAHRWRR